MRNIFFILFLLLACNFFAQETGFIPYKLNKKWIVLNDSCQIISKEKYDTVFLLGSDGLSRVKQKNKWGCINGKAQPIIPSVYDEISEFDGSGYTRVRKNNKWGFINKENKIVVPIIYNSIGFFSTYAKYHYAKVRLHDSTYYIDRKGNWINLAKTESFGVCGTRGGAYGTNTLSTIKSTIGLYGLIELCNKKDTLLPCIYKNIVVNPHSAFVIVEKDKYALIDPFKKMEILTDCDSISFYRENNSAYWILYSKKGATGFVHPYGWQITEINYKSIKIISGYYIYITDDKNQSYYINYKGKKFIPI